MYYSDTVLKLCKVGFLRGESAVLTDLNFQLRSGENLAIIGPNGAGKTTLMRLLSADIIPAYDSQSFVEILGNRVASCDLRKLRECIGLVCGRSAERFETDITVERVVASGLRGEWGSRGSLSGQESAYVEKSLSSFEILALKDNQYNRLSDGQKRRVLLARANVNEPELFILDEPCQGLDVPSKRDLVRQIDTLMSKSVIIVTHDITWLPERIDKVLLLKNGRIMAFGEKSEILNSKLLSETFDAPVTLSRIGKQFFIH